MLVKGYYQLLHIDCRLLLRNNAPIGQPPLSIAPEIEVILREFDVWGQLRYIFVYAFMSLLKFEPESNGRSEMMFKEGEFGRNGIWQFLQRKFSLSIRERDN